MGRIIVVEDNPVFADYVCRLLASKDFQSVSTFNCNDARKLFAKMQEDDIVLADMRLPDGDGIALLAELRKQVRNNPYIVMTEHGDIPIAVRSLKLGAEDFIPKNLLEMNLPPLLRSLQKRAEQQDAPILERTSEAFRKIYDKIRLVAPTNMSVLILGESGTGKEHIAEKIHARSKRTGKPVVPVDCGLLSKELAASELLGHEKGAFMEADSKRQGVWEDADGGTLFLDEIGNLPLEVQQMLLRALEAKRYRPTGGNKDKKADVRIIAATNEDLQGAVAEKRFRKDLLYRLQDFTITVPTLQDCLEAILPLADFFRIQSAGQLGKEIPDFDEAAKKILLGYGWPGNVRELKQVVHVAVLICGGKLITPQCLRLQQAGKTILNLAKEEKINNCLLKDEQRNAEQIRMAVTISKGNLTQAAALLGISRPTLYKKMGMYGITKEQV